MNQGEEAGPSVSVSVMGPGGPGGSSLQSQATVVQGHVNAPPHGGSSVQQLQAPQPLTQTPNPF